jgi:DNA-binding SARP family transcriptional activator
MTDLRVLGSIALDCDRADRVGLDAILAQTKRTALLTYLALREPGAPQRRDHLMGVFWPELPQPDARAALRRALSFLRVRLEPGIVVARGELVALSAAHFHCDAVGFRTALREGRRSAALALYRGPLLDGFFVRGAPEFERWLELERAALQRRATDAAVALAEEREGNGDLHEATSWLRRALEITPVAEGAVRRLVSVLARAGERAEAIRAFDEYAGLLARRYELEPSAQTRRLVAALTDGAASPTDGEVVRAWSRKETRHSGEKAQARDLVAEALPLVERSADDNRRAMELLQRALRIDESCVEAHAALAMACDHGVVLFGRPRAQLTQGLQAGRMAVSMDASVPGNHISLGLGLEAAGRLPEAEAAYRTAGRLDPRNGLALSLLARVTMFAGNFVESLRWARQSVRIAPEDPHPSANLAIALHCLGLDDPSDRWFEAVLEQSPAFPFAESVSAYCAVSRGDLHEADRRTRRLLDRDPQDYAGRQLRGVTALVAGHGTQARADLEALYEADPANRFGPGFLSARTLLAHVRLQDGDHAGGHELLREARVQNLQSLASGSTFGGTFYDQAQVCALSGEEERALEWLEASHTAGFRQPALMRRDPLLARLRRYERFDRIVRAVETEVREQRTAAGSLVRALKPPSSTS